MEKIKTSISLDKDIYEFLQQLAEEERTNVSRIINQMAAKLMKEKGK